MSFSQPQPLDRGISSSGRACCEAMETELKEAKKRRRNAKADRTSCGLLEVERPEGEML